jgi:predicted RNA polymerase sigma factor
MWDLTEDHQGMTDIHRTIEAVWKIESTRLIAGIARVARDIGIP